MLDQAEVVEFMAVETIHYAEAVRILQFSDAHTDHHEKKEAL